MPKPYTFPTLYNDLKTVSISFLTKHGYLKPNKWQSGTITWSCNGKKTGSISISVNTQPENAYLELDYRSNEAPVNYKVQLVSAPSNLGKGVVWYFICPNTRKRCRKLYLNRGFFISRFAIPGGMYDCQTVSKIYKGLLLSLKHDAIYEQLQKPYFKTHYKGVETNRYKRLREQLRRAEQLNNEVKTHLIHNF